MSIRGRWQSWRCHRGKHQWTRIHPPVWSGGYMRCDHCGRRTVQGGDSYGPAAQAWISHGITPPTTIPGIFYKATDWREWNERVRAHP